MIKKLAVIVTFVAVASFVFAQGGGGGGRGGRMGMGQGRNMGPLQLANRADVQADLKVTADQKSKLEALRQKQQDEQRARMEEMRNSGGGGNFDPNEMRKQMEAQNAKMQEEVNKILDKSQQLRLKEIGIQLQGNRALLNPEIQKELGVTAAQKASIDSLMAKQQQANESIMEKMRNQEIDREAAMEARRKNDEALAAELGKVLTQAQQDQLKKMGGAPFKADPQPGRGPGGGGN